MKYFFFFLLSSISIFPQISPGDLTNFHSKLEGISNCTKCHILGKQVNDSKCLDCHKEIKELIANGRGYHSSGDVKGKTCCACHSEHHGKNFRIINFNQGKLTKTNTFFIQTFDSYVQTKKKKKIRRTKKNYLLQ